MGRRVYTWRVAYSLHSRGKSGVGKEYVQRKSRSTRKVRRKRRRKEKINRKHYRREAKNKVVRREIKRSRNRRGEERK